eukprot:TRINITY_DN1557_c0_g2_i1.p1 TRINITY_DN1557_c0_g2~~TRINITY_DN1557_c0_g2_i1.p1  ORF type:complete len:593 (-),score=81.10 TRINITY_DN1557_c0_g2_i1:23-1801(-)
MNCGLVRGNVHYCKGDINGCHGGGVWGTGIYTSDSNKCSAARHAGVIGREGGHFLVMEAPGQNGYVGSTRYGMISSSYGRFRESFTVGAVGQQQTNVCKAISMNAFFCKGVINGCQGGDVWGSGPYTSDSNKCSAARHAGVIGVAGGTFTFTSTPGQSSYKGSTKNDVTSMNYGHYGSSFIVAHFDVQIVQVPSVVIESCRVRDNNTYFCKGLNNGCKGGRVWGTKIYTGDSNKCSAALHSGAIGPDGGEARFNVRPGKMSYQGCQFNGVKTYDWNSFENSFEFVVNESNTSCRIMSPSSFFCKGRSNGCKGEKVWGSGVYTSDSDLCCAALHSGAIGQNGGIFEIESLPGQKSYEGSILNGITSLPYSAWKSSFRVLGSTLLAKFCGQLKTGEYCCKGIANGCQGGEVWGSGPYTSDSNKCSAALHSGTISPNGGSFLSQSMPGQSSYRGSTSNGITSKDYGKWDSSFSIGGTNVSNSNYGNMGYQGQMVYPSQGQPFGNTGNSAYYPINQENFQVQMVYPPQGQQFDNTMGNIPNYPHEYHVMNQGQMGQAPQGQFNNFQHPFSGHPTQNQGFPNQYPPSFPPNQSHPPF